jgi:hypothetical protein
MLLMSTPFQKRHMHILHVSSYIKKFTYAFFRLQQRMFHRVGHEWVIGNDAYSSLGLC